MGGGMKLINKIDKKIGEKAFVINVKGQVVREETEPLSPESIDIDVITKRKIIIFEDQAF